MLHSCRNALFHCLLFNSSLNSPKFKFELNMFESISKENAKPFSLSPSLFSPAGPIPPSLFPSLSHFFSFLSRGPKHLHAPAHSLSPAQPGLPPLPFLSATDRWGHLSGPSPSPCSLWTLVESGCHPSPAPPRAWPARQGPPPAYKRRRPVLLEPYRASAAAQPAQTLAAAAAIGAPAELGATAVSPFRHAIDAEDRLRSFVLT